MTFTKLFSSITESTVWCEPHPVRIVWITMLAMANKHGMVFGSIPGLANRARVTVPEVEEAIDKFLKPDPYSRTKDFEGRRIVEIDGGWHLLTYGKHRAIRDEEHRRDYMRNLMRKKRALAKTVSDVSQSKPQLAQAEAEADKVKVKTREGVVPNSSDPTNTPSPSLSKFTQHDHDEKKLRLLAKFDRDYQISGEAIVGCSVQEAENQYETRACQYVGIDRKELRRLRTLQATQ